MESLTALIFVMVIFSIITAIAIFMNYLTYKTFLEKVKSREKISFGPVAICSDEAIAEFTDQFEIAIKRLKERV